MNTSQFASVGRQLQSAARRLGLEAPAFRTPSFDNTLDRAVRRLPSGLAMVEVRLGDHTLDDMVWGVAACNNRADDLVLRAELKAAVKWPSALGGTP